MAPKVKKGKKAQDDWDEGLGEVADPIAQAEAEAKAEEEDDVPQGGLMAALRKNKEKRKKKGKTVDDDEEDLSAKAPVEASMDDEDLFANPKKGKKSAKDEDGEDGGKLKTKAEKEKEKKEREKARKKDQAAAKKKSTPAPAPVKVEVAPVEAPPPEAPGKKKKLNPALAALQKQQEELRRRQQEDERSKVEEQERLADEQRKLEEEEKRKAEQKAAKKEREKKKIEEQKRAGTYKTDKQKKDEAQAKLRLQQMLESGVAKIAGADADDKPKKDRKRNPKKEAEERRAQQAREQEELVIRQKEEEAARVAAEAEQARLDAEEIKADEEEESDGEDWEAMADKSDVKDSWDASSDDGKSKPTNGAKKEESEEEDSDDDSSDEEDETVAERQARERKEQAHAKRQRELEAARAAASKENLRSPICCILGHVDTGKTSLLDHIRSTSVQAGEAGGITQQIGATYFPADALRAKTAVVNKDDSFNLKVPGLLIIDTPGHESFSNMRSRGSSLCNIAILVVDIMHGLEPQTLESMRLLRDRKTPFIVALNKIDRLYAWQSIPNNGFQASLAAQKQSVQNEFADRLEKTKLAFAEQGFNAELVFKNTNMAKNVSLVPTSAFTGEGIPDLLKVLVTLTQNRMASQLMYIAETEATILEKKQDPGLGTTIDIILINGTLSVGDRIVVAGTNGPINTDIRSLLTPQPLKELRIKSQYVHNQTVKAALGVKIAAQGLEDAISGSRVLLCKDPDDEDELDDLEDEVMSDLQHLTRKLSKTGRGVTVMASTLGSLEALLEFLEQSKIPVSSFGIGNIFKRDVITASAMLEKSPEHALMLAFDVKVDPAAREMADQMGIRIFEADIIYHLFDAFKNFQKQRLEEQKEQNKLLAVFPCVLKQVAVFNRANPMVIGCDTIEGSLVIGTPLAVVRQNPVTRQKEIHSLGRVTSIERDHKAVPALKKGAPSAAIKVEGSSQPIYGRNIEESDLLYSQISRASIDCLKTYYRDEVAKEQWALIKNLKPLFDVP